MWNFERFGFVFRTFSVWRTFFCTQSEASRLAVRTLICCLCHSFSHITRMPRRPRVEKVIDVDGNIREEVKPVKRRKNSKREQIEEYLLPMVEHQMGGPLYFALQLTKLLGYRVTKQDVSTILRENNLTCKKQSIVPGFSKQEERDAYLAVLRRVWYQPGICNSLFSFSFLVLLVFN